MRRQLTREVAEGLQQGGHSDQRVAIVASREHFVLAEQPRLDAGQGWQLLQALLRQVQLLLVASPALLRGGELLLHLGQARGDHLLLAGHALERRLLGVQVQQEGVVGRQQRGDLDQGGAVVAGNEQLILGVHPSVNTVQRGQLLQALLAQEQLHVVLFRSSLSGSELLLQLGLAAQDLLLVRLHGLHGLPRTTTQHTTHHTPAK